MDGSDDVIEGVSDRIEFDSVTNQIELIGQANFSAAATNCAARRFPTTPIRVLQGHRQPNAQGPSGRVRATIMPKPHATQPAAKP